MRFAEREGKIDWLAGVQDDVLQALASQNIITAGFGAGPGCMAQKVGHFTEPISLAEGLRWLDRWSSTLKRARLVFANGTTLHFYGHGFARAIHSSGRRCTA